MDSMKGASKCSRNLLCLGSAAMGSVTLVSAGDMVSELVSSHPQGSTVLYVGKYRVLPDGNDGIAGEGTAVD